MQELPPLWRWMLSVERRLIKLETRGEKTTGHTGDNRTFTPRDWMLTFAGLSMLCATLTEKIGWTTFGAFLIKLYGPR